MTGPLISFLTDFGANTAPAVCRGVIWSIAPDARILDLTHSVRQFAVRDGAFLLWSALPYLEVGVHLAVVDPGVGTERRGIALQTGRGDRMVGPDNGLLVPAAERLGGIAAAHSLEHREFFLDRVSTTFHGRDVFAPVAARLASGTAVTEVGPAIDPADLVRIEFPEPRAASGGLDTSVLFIDAFGNCRLAGDHADLERACGPTAPGRQMRVQVADRSWVVTWQATFGGVPRGEPLLYEDADYAGLALAINSGSAADAFGLSLDVPIRVEPARPR
jgi:S-adenosylmethionine hydrolase